ncbi:MAG: pyridoxal-phosphate dependent enzyme [Candidatus Paceibacterota bacterium]
MKHKTNSVTTISSEIHTRPDIFDFIKSTEPLSKIFDLPTKISPSRTELYRKLYNGIGNNDCYCVNLPNNNTLRIKMEYANSLGNNHYSRYWVPYLFIAETLGVIDPDSTKILEVTSGSSGIALSMACEKLDYDLTMLVPSMLPKGRTQPMIDAGTKLIKVDGYIDACILRLREIISNEDYFAANHSEERLNLITYIFSRIGYEYQFKYGNPDIAILGLGNGTSTEAVAKVLRSKQFVPKIYAFHPSLDGDDVVLGLLARNLHLRHVEPAKQLVDKILSTTEFDIEEVRNMFRHDTEVSNLGHSSLFAIKFAYDLSLSEEDKTIFSIGYDKIDRYKN